MPYVLVVAVPEEGPTGSETGSRGADESSTGSCNPPFSSRIQCTSLSPDSGLINQWPRRAG